MSRNLVYYASDDPVFIDTLAVDIAVLEHRFMQLTAAEKRHAAHRLSKQVGVSYSMIAGILRVTERTVLRLLKYPPPPVLDVNADGQIIDDTGQFVSDLADTLAG